MRLRFGPLFEKAVLLMIRDGEATMLKLAGMINDELQHTFLGHSIISICKQRRRAFRMIFFFSFHFFKANRNIDRVAALKKRLFSTRFINPVKYRAKTVD